MANLSTDNCQSVFRFYTDVAVAGPVCVAGIVGSCLAFAALGFDTALSPTAVFLLRCLAFSDGVLLASWLDSHSLPALLAFVGIDESVQSMSWTQMRLWLYPLEFISQMTTAWLTALIASWRYVTIGLLSSPDCPGSRVGSAACSLYGIRAVVATVAVLSVAFNVPRFFQFHAVDILDPDNVTHYGVHFTEVGSGYSFRVVYAVILYTVVTFLLPYLVLTVFSVLLIRVYRAQRRRREAMFMSRGNLNTASTTSTSSSTVSSEHSVTRVIVVVMVVFAVCNFPAKLFDIVYRVRPHCGTLAYLARRLCFVLEVVNSAANFVVYCALRHQFRDGLRRALQPQNQCRQQRPPDGASPRPLRGQRARSDTPVDLELI